MSYPGRNGMGQRSPPLPFPQVVYEDDHVTKVDKPEGLITVGVKREDMPSVLTFILRLPAPAIPCRCHRHSSGNSTVTSLPRHV